MATVLVSPKGNEYTVESPTEAARLRARGYTERVANNKTGSSPTKSEMPPQTSTK